MKLRLFDIKDIDELIFRLSGIGVSVGSIYEQLGKGANELEITIDEDQLPKVKSAIADLCQYEVLQAKENTKALPFLLLGILWIDSLFLYILLKFSFPSHDFGDFLSYILGSTRLAETFKNLISLLAIVVYYTGFILTQNTTPAGRFFRLQIEKDHIYFVVLFSLPLIAFKLIQFSQTPIRLLGVLALSLCLVLPFYLKNSVKCS